MRNKTNQDCAVVVGKGNINGIDVTFGATNFEFTGVDQVVQLKLRP